MRNERNHKNRVTGLARISLFILVMCFAISLPSTVFAEAEITGVVGGLVGGDLDNVFQGIVSIKGTFDNGALYGVRIGFVGGLFGVEGSFVYSPTGVSLSTPVLPVNLNAKVYYWEGNFLFIPIPGPISPFLTAGAGLHMYNFDLNVGNVGSIGADFDKFGYNFGAGLKINISRVVIRGEVRDHLTKFERGDFGLSDIGIDIEDQWLHNIEISAGIGFRF